MVKRVRDEYVGVRNGDIPRSAKMESDVVSDFRMRGPLREKGQLVRDLELKSAPCLHVCRNPTVKWVHILTIHRIPSLAQNAQNAHNAIQLLTLPPWRLFLTFFLNG